MKDAYSFHLNDDSLNETYQNMFDTYVQIFTRTGLNFRPVAADSGSIGGNLSHEFHVLADSGEDAIAFSDQSDYAANVEFAEAMASEGERPAPSMEMQRLETPGQHTIEDVSKFLNVPAEKCIKTLLVKGSEDGTIIALTLRGDHELNAIKATKHNDVAEPLEMATADEIKRVAGCSAGSIGPVDLKCKILVDRGAAQLNDFVCGANTDDIHLTGVNWVRDLPEAEIVDIRNVVNGRFQPRR